MSTKEPRDQDDRDKELSHDVSERQLQERQVPAEGVSRNADQRHRARLGRDDGGAEGPPRHLMVSEKVVADRRLAAREARSQRDDGGQIDTKDHEVEGVRGR